MRSATALASLEARSLRIPFRATFAHAAAARAETAAVWVCARGNGGATGFGEGCPREYVTGESVNGALAFIDHCRAEVCREAGDLDSLRRWAQVNETLIDAHPAAWCAIELALLDLFARRCGMPVEALLDSPRLKGTYRYTAVLGDAQADTFAAQVQRYVESGFSDFKLKISGDAQRDRERIRALCAAAPLARVRVDANNLWRDADAALAHLRALEAQLYAVEEPLAAGDYVGCARLSDALGVPIILDESFLRLGQLDRLAGNAARWILNVRVSKLGGLLRSLDVLRAARDRGVPVIVGAQVGETSVLTRAGLTLASAAMESLIAQEGAFGTYLLSEDVSDPVLMFGPGGVLDATQLNAAPGFGLRVKAEYQ